MTDFKLDMRKDLLDYLKERRTRVEMHLEDQECAEHVDEYVRVDDLIRWLETVIVEQVDELRASTVGYRRSGLARRLRPAVDQLMDDGLPRTMTEILDALGEPDKTAACLNSILTDWEYKGLYRRNGRRNRRDVWRKNSAVYQHPPTAETVRPELLTGDDGSVFRLARD